MRAFIAIDLPEEAKKELIEIQNKLNTKNSKLSLTKDHHLTLKFLGEVEENKIDSIKERLSKIKFKKFKLKLDGIGFFPSENYIRVIWVGLTPVDESIDLNKKTNSALKEFPDDFKFHPHITLARVKFIENKKEFINKLKEIKIRSIEFEVTGFKLKNSTLAPSGPIYCDLGVFGFI